jgi:hypothetical protein
MGALLSLPACGGRDNEVANVNGSGKGGLSSRYEAAIAINSIAKRNEALSAVARDAAKEGDAGVVKKCIQSINSISVRDDAAFTAAIALAQFGKGQEAKEVAQTINDITRRDEALAKIAKGN